MHVLLLRLRSSLLRCYSQPIAAQAAADSSVQPLSSYSSQQHYLLFKLHKHYQDLLLRVPAGTVLTDNSHRAAVPRLFRGNRPSLIRHGV